MARKTKAKTTGPDVRVKMIAPHSYRLDARTKRSLPKGWSGLVPAAIADEIEAAGTGERDEPFEIIDSKDTGMRAAKEAGAKGAGNAKGAKGSTGGAATSTDSAATATTDTGAGAAPASGGDAGAGQGDTTDLLGQGGTGGN